MSSFSSKIIKIQQTINTYGNDYIFVMTEELAGKHLALELNQKAVNHLQGRLPGDSAKSTMNRKSVRIRKKSWKLAGFHTLGHME